MSNVELIARLKASAHNSQIELVEEDIAALQAEPVPMTEKQHIAICEASEIECEAGRECEAPELCKRVGSCFRS